MSLEPGWITNRQIEASRVAMTREMKRGGKVWIRIFPDKPITKKPAETRMGKGKGNPEGWVAVVKPGRVLFEIEGISEDLAKKALALASAKLPVQDARSCGARRSEPMKANEMRETVGWTTLQGQARGAARGALQPALPLRHRVDREPDALPRAPARHRAAARRSCAEQRRPGGWHERAADRRPAAPRTAARSGRAS